MLNKKELLENSGCKSYFRFSCTDGPVSKSKNPSSWTPHNPSDFDTTPRIHRSQNSCLTLVWPCIRPPTVVSPLLLGHTVSIPTPTHGSTSSYNILAIRILLPVLSNADAVLRHTLVDKTKHPSRLTWRIRATLCR